MKRVISRIGLVCLLVASLIVLNSCSTSKKATIPNVDASVTVNVPDYQQIKKDINKKDSEFYYPELLRRFQEADTTLSFEQLRHFYYGTATRPEYNPYQFDLSKALNEALLSSGDGKTKESAIYVINIADEYALMYRFGVTPTSQSLVRENGQSYDRMELTNNEKGLKVLYFNVTIMEESLKKLF